ncbi:MAG: hypothetical protein GY769_15440 [bacterium]|nr:hypothetical protein [bacterium]
MSGRLALGCAVLVASFTACDRAPGGTYTTGNESARGGTVVIATGVDITGVNQLTGGGSRFEQDILDQLFLSLFQEQPDYAEHPPTFEPELAQDYTWSEDGKTLRLLLRPGIEWSDGVPITAADVVWTYTAQVNPEVAWEEAQSKDAIERVVAFDDHTVEFRFSEVYSSRLSDLNEGVILPKHAWSKLPFSEWRGNETWFLDNLVVSGPFMLARLQPQQQIVLERNENHFRQGYPKLDRLVFRVIPNRTNQVEHLLAGQVDFVEHVLPKRAADVERSGRTDLISKWHRQYTYIGWNGCQGLFEDASIRKAMTLAIDRESIVKALWGESARPAVSPILTSVWAFNPDLVPWPYDPDAARRLLAKAGWGDDDGDGYLDKDGRKFSFELATNGDNQIRADVAVLVQEQLRKIGVEARVSLLEFNSLWARHQSHGVDAIISAWGIDTSLNLTYAFHTDSIEDGKNYGCYSNAQVDELIALARRPARPEDAAPPLHRIQEILHEEQPYTFLWEPMRHYGVSKKVKNAQPNPLSAYFNLDEWWLAPVSS